MPRRVIDRDENLHIDLRLGPKRDERRRWVDRRLRQRHLPKPLHHLGAQGVWVPKPPANSQRAIVKLWKAKTATTGGHPRGLARGGASRYVSPPCGCRDSWGVAGWADTLPHEALLGLWLQVSGAD